MKKIEINQEEVYKFYIDSDNSIVKSVEKFNVSYSFIYKCLRAVDGKKRVYQSRDKYRKIATREFLIKEYSINKKSSIKISNDVGCTKTFILERLHEFNIPLRDVKQLNKDRGVFMREENHPGFKDKIKTKCVFCDKEMEVYPYKIKSGKNIFCSNKCKAKFRVGKLAANWQGGLSFEKYPKEFNDTLKEQIRNRDNRVCQICGKTEAENGRKLDVHHIDYDKKNNDPNNLISLCHVCHMKTNKKSRDCWKEYFFNLLSENSKVL